MALAMRRGEDQPIARWIPLREIEDTWTRMGSLLGDVVGGEGRSFTPLSAMGLPVDIEEADDAFVVTLDLPGVRHEDVSVDLREDELSVTGEIKESERAGVLRRQNRRIGRFEHRIALPGKVNPDAVQATLADGVLTVRLGKESRSQSRHIEVKA